MADKEAETTNIHIIAVAHQKGGTGKTTAVCALAASMASLKPDLKVAVVDLDPQGASTLYLGGEGPYRDGAYDIVIAGKPLNDAVYRTEVKNCGLAPATPRLVLSEMDLASRSMSFDDMANHLKKTATGFDVIIIDCPSGFGLMSTMIMTIADLVVIPTPPAFFAVRALRETISYLNRLRSDAKVLTAVVLNMIDPGNSMQKIIAKKVRHDWGDLVVPVEIPRDDVVELAAAENKLLVHQNPNSAAAKAYDQLAGCLAYRLGLIEQEPEYISSDTLVQGRVELEDSPAPKTEAEQVEGFEERRADRKTADRREDRAPSAPERGDQSPAAAETLDTSDVPQSSTEPQPSLESLALPEGITSGTTENLAPVKPNSAAPRPTGGMPRFLKLMILSVLLVLSVVVIYFAIQYKMLFWVMLAYLILILIFFPALVFLLV
jgi:chromosome partitioning protein